jgi:hypothetical protein
MASRLKAELERCAAERKLNAALFGQRYDACGCGSARTIAALIVLLMR